MRYYRDLADIYPNEILETNNYYVARGLVTHEFIDRLRNSNSPSKEFVDYYEPGKEHLFLISKSEGVMMSDYPDEKITNQKFLDNAHGDVLIFGLGLGLIVFPLLDDPDISSITIVEKDEELPSIIEPIIKSRDTFGKVRVINGDVFTFSERILGTFDTIYFDIWARITDESFEQMELLHDMYKPFLRDESSYIDSWRYEAKDAYKSKLNKDRLWDLAKQELGWLKFYSNIESRNKFTTESDFYSDLKPVGYTGGLIELDKCCFPCVITSDKPISHKTKVSDLRTITSDRNRGENKYTPLEIFWMLYPKKRSEIVAMLK